MHRAAQKGEELACSVPSAAGGCGAQAVGEVCHSMPILDGHWATSLDERRGSACRTLLDCSFCVVPCCVCLSSELVAHVIRICAVRAVVCAADSTTRAAARRRRWHASVRCGAPWSSSSPGHREVACSPRRCVWSFHGVWWMGVELCAWVALINRFQRAAGCGLRTGRVHGSALDRGMICGDGSTGPGSGC